VAQVERIGRWAAVGIGFSIPLSVALDSVLLALALLAWIAGGAWREKVATVRANPVALAALVLFAVLAAGTLYGERYPGDALGYLGKYLDLLAVPALLYFFRDTRHREHALLALAVGLAVMLTVSYGVAVGVVPHGKPFSPDSVNPVAFKFKLTQNILMAFGAFLFAGFAARAATSVGRCAWAVLSLAAALNVTFLVDGLTGQLMLGAFVVYAGYLWKGTRGLVVAAAVAIAGALVLATVSEPIRARLQTLGPELEQWRSGQVRRDASTGTRLELYSTSLSIVREHPLAGVGTGGYPKAYAEHTRGRESRNPHGEYLLIAVQTGLLGLAALAWLLATQWRCSARLPRREAELARALVLMMVIGCLFNSMLLDHTEGLLYAWLTAVIYGSYGDIRVETRV
jgi:O-antigen ligase